MLKSPFLVLAVLMALLAPGLAVAQSSGPATVYPLLVNASASGNLFGNVLGGNYQLNLAGTVGGSTVTVTVSDSAGVQQTVATFTATGTQCIAIPANANMQGIVSGGSPSGLYLKASGVQFCPTGSATAVVTVVTTPTDYSTTPVGSSVTTHLTFQSALAASTTRHGCLLQNTSADTEYVYFGATGSATTSNSLKINPTQTVNCATLAGGIADDNIAITSGATDGATYVVNAQ